MSDFVLTVLADDSVHDECETRERIETWRYNPSEFDGRPVAYSSRCTISLVPGDAETFRPPLRTLSL